MSDGLNVQAPLPVQAPPPVQAPAESVSQQKESTDIEKLIAEKVAAALGPLQSQLEKDKAEKAGLDRRNTELEKLLEDQKKAATEQKLTDSERIAAIEEREAIAQREREAERREAEKAVKIATWRSEAVARGLPDDTYVDATLSLEDGVKYLEGYQAKVQEKITAGINAKLGSSTLPGSGNIGEATPDRTGWTGAQWADHFAKKSKATVVGNPAVPGVTGAA